MKLIELLNKIANGEIKEGTKIKVPFLNEKFYEYAYLNDDKLWAKHKGGESIFTIKASELNEEVEIIEEKQPTNKVILELENALYDMVYQFAFDSEDRLYTGGLSALDNAFDVLNINEGITREDFWKKQKELNDNLKE
jgi:hypothetical protein